MKRLIASIAAIAGLLAGVGPALADCPSGHVPAAGGAPGFGFPSVNFGINAFSIGSGVPQAVFDGGPKTDTNCVTAVSVAVGGDPAVTGEWVVKDPNNTPDDPSDDVSKYRKPVTGVLGQNSSALGNRATVGRVETYIDDNGTPDDTTDDTEETRIVPVNKGTAIGADSHVGHSHSTAIGADASTSNDHQVSIGTGNDTIKARGITSDLSKDRQSGPLEVVTTDEFGNLASDGGQVFDRLNEHDAALASLNNKISKVNGRVDEAYEGVAMALAMESPQVDPGKTFGIALNYGNFEGENALAAAAKLRFDETWAATGGVGYGMGSNTVGVRAGLQAQW